MAKNEPFKYTVCSMCGKKFIKQVGHIFHVSFAGVQNQCCSYTCYEKAKKVKAENDQSTYTKYRKEFRSK